MLESVGKDSVVPGLLASTFAGSSDEDIARACEKMRAPPGARWDVSAKIKMRDEKLREVRTMLSRVAEQRRAFGTLVTKIEEKLLKNTREERERADKADRALIVGSGLGDRLEKLEAQRDAAVEAAKLAEVKLAAAEEAGLRLLGVSEDAQAGAAVLEMSWSTLAGRGYGIPVP